MKISDIMTREVITVVESDTVEKCANLLSKNDLSGLPVLDGDGKVIGIVTEGDLIRRVSKMNGPSYLEVLGGIIYLESAKDLMEEVQKYKGNLVSDIMTRKLITIGQDEDIEDAATLLVKKKIKRLPVVDEDDKLIGIVSRKDIMHYLFDKK